MQEDAFSLSQVDVIVLPKWLERGQCRVGVRSDNKGQLHVELDPKDVLLLMRFNDASGVLRIDPRIPRRQRANASIGLWMPRHFVNGRDRIRVRAGKKEL